MALYICKTCGGRNTSGGRCILCDRSLGSPPVAVLAAVVSAALLGLLWVGLSYTRVQPLMLTLLYGGLVSGAVVHYSAGRGFLYQAIASAATVVGMLIADSAVVWLHWQALSEFWSVATPRPPFWELVPLQAQYDGITGAACVMGLLGGLWVWTGD